MDGAADRMTTTELQRIRQAAERIREQSQVLVVVGIGGSYLGARAAIELLRGQQYNLTSKTIQILFAGNSFSTRSHQELLELLSGRDFSVCIISKSGHHHEPALVTRSLKWLLEQKYGAEEAQKRIYVITDPTRGALRQMAQQEGYEAFPIPPDVGGRYSVLSAVGLLPMAVAGIDPGQVLLGGSEARRQLDIRSFENPAWLYGGGADASAPRRQVPLKFCAAGSRGLPSSAAGGSNCSARVRARRERDCSL